MREPMIVTSATMAMGTRFELVLAGADEWALGSAADEAIEGIDTLHGRLSLFQTDSLVSHINRTAAAAPVRVERDVFEMLLVARAVWEASGGAFDITMAGVMRSLGLHARPGEQGVSDAVWGMQFLELDEARLAVRFARPGLAIDLGGLAKGFALDAAGEVLRSHGIRCALLHAGTSSVTAIGAPDDQPEGWRVALGERAGGAPVAVLRDAALSVSAHHGRAVEHEGETVGHVLDPRTGRSASGASAARLAACVARSGTLAEAWSTALLVLGARPAGMDASLVHVLHMVGGSGPAWQAGGDEAGSVVRF
jgi:thiamine biosynthesis lipoprotein